MALLGKVKSKVTAASSGQVSTGGKATYEQRAESPVSTLMRVAKGLMPEVESELKHRMQADVLEQEVKAYAGLQATPKTKNGAKAYALTLGKRLKTEAAGKLIDASDSDMSEEEYNEYSVQVHAKMTEKMKGAMLDAGLDPAMQEYAMTATVNALREHAPQIAANRNRHYVEEANRRNMGEFANQLDTVTSKKQLSDLMAGGDGMNLSFQDREAALIEYVQRAAGKGNYELCSMLLDKDAYKSISNASLHDRSTLVQEALKKGVTIAFQKGKGAIADARKKMADVDDGKMTAEAYIKNLMAAQERTGTVILGYFDQMAKAKTAEGRAEAAELIRRKQANKMLDAQAYSAIGEMMKTARTQEDLAEIKDFIDFHEEDVGYEIIKYKEIAQAFNKGMAARNLQEQYDATADYMYTEMLEGRSSGAAGKKDVKNPKMLAASFKNLFIIQEQNAIAELEQKIDVDAEGGQERLQGAIASVQQNVWKRYNDTITTYGIVDNDTQAALKSFVERKYQAGDTVTADDMKFVNRFMGMDVSQRMQYLDNKSISIIEYFEMNKAAGIGTMEDGSINYAVAMEKAQNMVTGANVPLSDFDRDALYSAIDSDTGAIFKGFKGDVPKLQEKIHTYARELASTGMPLGIAAKYAAKAFNADNTVLDNGTVVEMAPNTLQAQMFPGEKVVAENAVQTQITRRLMIESQGMMDEDGRVDFNDLTIKVESNGSYRIYDTKQGRIVGGGESLQNIPVTGDEWDFYKKGAGEIGEAARGYSQIGEAIKATPAKVKESLEGLSQVSGEASKVFGK